MWWCVVLCSFQVVELSRKVTNTTQSSWAHRLQSCGPGCCMSVLSRWNKWGTQPCSAHSMQLQYNSRQHQQQCTKYHSIAVVK
jgi:hypothetical protein